MFGVGYIPVASGTFGSLATLPIAWYLHQSVSLPFYFLFTVLLCCIAFGICHHAGKVLGEADSSIIVLDEMVGQLIALTFVGSLETYFICFLLFRFFDIWKPFPANFFDKNWKNGFGVTLDDAVAGTYALLSAMLFSYILRTWGLLEGVYFNPMI
jgi:phosphatidylglycerophosphatase A